MSTTTAPGQLDMDAFKRALEGRDAAALAGMFADDAEMIMVDYQHPPSSPRRLSGREQIRALFDDVCSRDMTHEVTRAVSGPEGAAYTEACRYADGMRVLTTCMLDVRDGKIARSEGVQAWDPEGA
jgi:ketosteroid isomerase-like protein